MLVIEKLASTTPAGCFWIWPRFAPAQADVPPVTRLRRLVSSWPIAQTARKWGVIWLFSSDFRHQRTTTGCRPLTCATLQTTGRGSLTGRVVALRGTHRPRDRGTASPSGHNVGSLARGELLQRIFELIERHRAHTAISTAGPTAIADDGRLPFRVSSPLTKSLLREQPTT